MLDEGAHERRRVTDRDHRTICKFRGADDPEWQQLAAALTEAASAAIDALDYSPTVQQRQAMLTFNVLERRGQC